MPQAETLTVKELASKFKMQPKQFRHVLRILRGKNNEGKRYEFKSNDAFLKKLPALIAEHQQRETEKKATAKK